MDRRVLAAIALVAVAAAVGMGMFLAPSVDPGPQPVEVATTPGPRPLARPVRPSGPAGNAKIRPAQGLPGAPKVNGVTPAVRINEARIERKINDIQEPTPEYRCRALGQQADLIDRLVVIGSGGAVDETQRAQMASRVAEMSIRVLDEGEALWAGDLSCEGISDVNLSSAADYLAKMQAELELDQPSSDQIEQALASLDAVDWPEELEE